MNYQDLSVIVKCLFNRFSSMLQKMLIRLVKYGKFHEFSALIMCIQHLNLQIKLINHYILLM